jgi:hypothetical protein
MATTTTASRQLQLFALGPKAIQPKEFPDPGSIEALEGIIAELLPPTIPMDLMLRRGREARRTWALLATTPLYEALTVWVMVAWPELPLERVDTMVRTAISAAPQVRNGHWSARRLSDVVRKAGRRQAHREVHHHLGRPVNLVSLDAMPFELADDLHCPPPAAASLGRDLVAHLRLALGDHDYMVTSNAVVLLDRYCDIAVDHLNAVQAKSVTAERPDGLVGLALFAAARPTKATNKSNRITDVFSDLPHPSAVALSHLLLGTDRDPQAALLWRHLSQMPPQEAPAEVVADWRAELPALCPTILGFSPRRRRRVRDRSRRGDDLRRVFEVATTHDAELEVPVTPGSALAT